MRPRQVLAVAKADLRERMRRPPIYMAMAVGAFICYLCVIGKAGVALEGSRGVWNSAWSAATLAVIATSYTTLVCFFVVRSSVQRDEETGVGKLVATAPVSSFSYLLGKWISNLIALLSVLLVFLAASPILQWSHHAGYPFRFWQFVNPFLYIPLPGIAFVAALAVLFECHPWVRRGIGNLVYIFIWIEMVRETAMYARVWTDMVGFNGLILSTQAAQRAQGMTPKGYGLNIGPNSSEHLKVFNWVGFSFSWQAMTLRLEWFFVAVALIGIATYFFRRFNPDARGALTLPVPKFLRRKKLQPASGTWESDLLQLTSVTSTLGSNRFFAVVRAEIKLLVTSIPKLVYVALGLANLIALMPAEKDGPSGPGVLAFLWIVPVLVWSNMGAREQAPYARPLIFSAPHSFLRQLPAEWLAGVIIALIGSSGVGISLLVHRNLSFFAVWLSGAMFIASLALACGTWSRGTRLFQGLYAGWWYLAMNNAPGMDFTGVTGQRHAAGYSLVALGLFASAMAHRWWNTERAAALQLLGLFRSPSATKELAA